MAPLGITAADLAIDAGIQEFKKKIHGSGNTTLIIPNKDMNDIENSNTLLKGVPKSDTKEQKGGFLSVLLGTLGASLLQNLLSGKGIVRAGTGNKKGKGIVRAGSGNKKGKGIVRAGTGKKLDF